MKIVTNNAELQTDSNHVTIALIIEMSFCTKSQLIVPLNISYSIPILCQKSLKVPLIPGMYRMEESSTTSFAPQQTPSVHETLLPNHTLASTTPSTSATASCIENHSSRPIMSILPQPMTSGNLTKPPFPLGLPPVVRSNSLGGSNSPGTLWTEPPHPPAIFHINGSHPRISSHQTSILPPPARFSSNQNLSSYILSDRGNPREIQKLYEYGPTSSPYSGEYLPVNHTSSYGPYPNASYFPPKMGNGGYCTSTLPSSLRRAGSGSATPSISSGMGVSARNGPGSQQPPLKSILRNPLIPQNSVGGICYPYPQTHPSFPEGDNPVRSYTPMSLGSAGGGRRITTEDFDFGESLLASGSGSDEQEHSYNSYNFPDYSLASQGNNGRIEGANLQVTNYSPGPDLGRYSLNPEYRNDINRLGMTDLDPESLSRLIELDMDSKL